MCQNGGSAPVSSQNSGVVETEHLAEGIAECG
jgi:hypothetical protein